MLEQIKLRDSWSETYYYDNINPLSACGHGNCRRDDNSVPDDKVLAECPSIVGFCVDGDGYISVILPDKDHYVTVYDPKGKLHCTVGETESIE
jgi:hypothetical protein